MLRWKVDWVKGDELGVVELVHLEVNRRPKIKQLIDEVQDYFLG